MRLAASCDSTLVNQKTPHPARLAHALVASWACRPGDPSNGARRSYETSRRHMPQPTSRKQRTTSARHGSHAARVSARTDTGCCPGALVTSTRDAGAVGVNTFQTVPAVSTMSGSSSRTGRRTPSRRPAMSTVSGHLGRSGPGGRLGTPRDGRSVRMRAETACAHAERRLGQHGPASARVASHPVRPRPRPG